MNSHHHEQHDQGMAYRDPVCGMSTDKEGEYIRHDHAGRSYYFCSEHCLTKFKQDPRAFAEK
jgi:Cu+-exporting ATPase